MFEGLMRKLSPWEVFVYTTFFRNFRIWGGSEQNFKKMCRQCADFSLGFCGLRANSLHGMSHIGICTLQNDTISEIFENIFFFHFFNVSNSDIFKNCSFFRMFSCLCQEAFLFRMICPQISYRIIFSFLQS